MIILNPRQDNLSDQWPWATPASVALTVQVCRACADALGFMPCCHCQEISSHFQTGLPALPHYPPPPPPFLVCIGPHNYGAGPGPGSSHGALGVAKGNCSSFAWHSRPFPVQCPDNLCKHPRTPQPQPETLPHTFPPRCFVFPRPGKPFPFCISLQFLFVQQDPEEFFSS